MVEYETYSTNIVALCINDEGLEVYVAHPDGEEERMYTMKEVRENDGHLFVVKWPSVTERGVPEKYDSLCITDGKGSHTTEEKG